MPTEMRFTREDLLPALTATAGLASRKNVLPGTSNILFADEHGLLRLTGSDMETEVSVDTMIPVGMDFSAVTLPAKKLLDILRNLPEGSEIVLKIGADGKAGLRSCSGLQSKTACSQSTGLFRLTLTATDGSSCSHYLRLCSQSSGRACNRKRRAQINCN